MKTTSSTDRCWWNLKISFANELEATEFLRDTGYDNKIYQCKFCGDWHLSKKGKDE